MILTRYLTAASVGLLVTTALLYVMQLLVGGGPLVTVESPARFVVDWIRPPKEERLVVDKYIRPSRPNHVLPLPPWSIDADPGPIGDHALRTATILPTIDRSTISRPGLADGPPVSIFKVAPAYPISAVSRNLEGYVIVSYDVLASGVVTNVAVVESSHRVFNTAAVEAAYRFRYKPRIVDGIASETYGLQSRFVFEMEK